MNITKLIEVNQVGGQARQQTTQPQWNVVFEADGKAFRVSRIIQFNKPELHHIQAMADQSPDYFWSYLAKPVVV